MTLPVFSNIPEAVARFLEFLPENATIGVAISGGSDSTALLLAIRQSRPRAQIKAATVDHGLRSGSIKEAKWVETLCRSLEVDHTTLTAKDLDDGPNLQARARAVRYQLLAGWARECDIVCLGHSQTDVAETFLMRLARGSGADGLSSMSASWSVGEINWARPLMNFTREDLKAYLVGQSQEWCEDPSNNDVNFTRVQMRQAQPILDSLGLTTRRLAKTARRMSQVREALDAALVSLWPNIAEVDFCDVIFDRKALLDLPSEYSERMLARALGWVSGNVYKPRNLALLRSMVEEKASTLHGCILIPQAQKYLRISREFAPVSKLEVCCPETWDYRFSAPDFDKNHSIRPLGRAGLALCSDWRETGRPRASMLSSPSLWKFNVLISAPMANFGQKDAVKVVPLALK